MTLNGANLSRNLGKDNKYCDFCNISCVSLAFLTDWVACGFGALKKLALDKNLYPNWTLLTGRCCLGGQVLP